MSSINLYQYNFQKESKGGDSLERIMPSWIQHSIHIISSHSKVEKKVNIWDKAGEASDIQFIPDADQDS